ncbi:MAG: ABC transporter permease subunit [Candidatus Obscuribacterales bacterium]|nr:ABC transporter permease subunit [Candidatus Obscuribacterales bacterium]
MKDPFFGATRAIALNTFREVSRDKIVYAFFAFAIGLLIFGQVLGSLSIGQQVRIIQDIGLAAIDLIGSAIAIFAGANLLYKERERGTIQFVFSKPVGAAQYVVGKFAGISACLGVLVVLMSIWLYLMLIFATGPIDSSATGALFCNLACAAALAYAEIAFVVAMSIFFACFTSPLMSVVFTLALWIAAHANASLLAAARLNPTLATAKLLQGAYWLLPDLETATKIRSSLIAGILCDATVLSGALAYLACYTAILLAVSSMVTDRREHA